MTAWKLFFLISLTALISCSHKKNQASGPDADFDKRYSKFTEEGAPGFQILLIKEGKIVKNDGFGFSGLSNMNKIDSQTLFRTASNTKSFTAAAALLLEQDKKLNIEDSIGKYFPDLPSSMKRIRIKNLIYHTSGLPDYDLLCDHNQNTDKKVTNETIMTWLQTNPKMLFNPGEGFEYSNTGYIVLAEVVAKASKMSFQDFVQTRIFDPLNMKSSLFYTPELDEKLKDRAFGYGAWPWFDSRDRDSCNYTAGDDGIFINSDDYAKYALALESETLFRKESLKKLFKTGRTKNGKAINYTYGWALIETKLGPAIAHSGSWTGFKTYVRYHPNKKIWIIVLSNYSDIPLRDILDHASKQYLETE